MLLAKTGRTIVRDPRKTRVPSLRTHEVPAEVEHNSQVGLQRQGLPFEPNRQNQQAVGSSLASYVLAGAGMSIGFAIVGAIFGGF